MTISAAKPTWVREDALLLIHERQIAEHGGIPGVRDLNALRSSLASSRNYYLYKSDVSVADCAAVYAWSLSHNHPFFDGNKRMALITSQLFLELNAYHLEASPIDKFTIFMNLAAEVVTKTDLFDWFHRHSKPRAI